MEEGLKKIQKNGDYQWFCNIAERGESTSILDYIIPQADLMVLYLVT